MDKKYTLGEIKINEKKELIFIKKENKCGKSNLEILKLEDVEKLLNTQEELLSEMVELKKRNDSLTTRTLNLRNEVDNLKKHQNDNEMIKEVCQIIQNRIDFVDHEPATQYVCEHMKAIKKQLKEERLWRI